MKTDLKALYSQYQRQYPLYKKEAIIGLMLDDGVINFELARSLNSGNSGSVFSASKQDVEIDFTKIFGGYFDAKDKNVLDSRHEFYNNSLVECAQRTLDKYNNVDGNWKMLFADYVPTDIAKYDKVHDYVAEYAGRKCNTTADVSSITNMICKLSDNYGIDPEITATILAHETGGFVFTPNVMSKRENYKGVSQVDYTTVEVLYASYNDRNDKSLTPHERAVAYSHRHCVQDEARINEIKSLYKKPKDLWKALEKDVALGLEVGIMAFKMKLNASKGDTKGALSGYCAGQYCLSPNSKAQMHYELPLPEYKSN